MVEAPLEDLKRIAEALEHYVTSGQLSRTDQKPWRALLKRVELRMHALADSKLPYKYVHRDGCGQTAFYLVCKPEVGRIIKANQARRLDGSIFNMGEHIVCGNCNQNVGPPRVDNVESNT